MVQPPKTKEERKKAEWMYSFDCETWNLMEEYWDTCPDTTVLCDACKNFLKARFPKEYKEAIKFWKKEKQLED